MNCAFPSTNWPLVASTRMPRPSRPMSILCAQYWTPVYAYLRQRGHRIDEAEDLTQSFFVHLLEKRVLEQARPERGRLRSLLLACLANFVANQRSYTCAKKRGGGLSTAPFESEPRDGDTPEMIYEREWAAALVRRVLERLRREFTQSGRKEVFDLLKEHLAGGRGHDGYRRAAAALNTTDAGARVAVHRLRRRYRQLLRDEIAGTLSGPDDVDDEIRYLIGVLQHRCRHELTS